jgi:hypothetical protein
MTTPYAVEPDFDQRVNKILEERAYWFEDQRYTVNVDNVTSAMRFLDTRAKTNYPNLKFASPQVTELAAEFLGTTVNEYELVVAADLLGIPISSERSSHSPPRWFFNVNFEEVVYTDYTPFYEQIHDVDGFAEWILETWETAQGRFGWWNFFKKSDDVKPTIEMAEYYAPHVLEWFDSFYFNGIKQVNCWSLKIRADFKTFYPDHKPLAFMTALVMSGQRWKWFNGKDGTVDIQTRLARK